MGAQTLQPKHGINLGVHFTQTLGIARLLQYERYFTHFPGKAYDPRLAQALGIAQGSEVEYYPRRAYNLWNTRYFVVPFLVMARARRHHGIRLVRAAERADLPSSSAICRSEREQEADKWIDTRDFRVLRNLQDHPALG